MERNWYLLYTKKQKEKKVVELLNRKGIENFCPFAISESKIGSTREVSAYQPLFQSYVFIRISEEQIRSVIQTPHTLNIAYWKSKPATISNEEIIALQIMTNNYQRIKVERTEVECQDKFEFKEQNITTQHNNVFSIKHKGHVAVLPSIGYRLSAQRDREQPILQPEIIPHPQGLKRLKALSFFGF